MLSRGRNLDSSPHEIRLLGDHVRQHVELLIEHACGLVDAGVIEGFEHDRWLVVAQVRLAVRALIDVHAQGKIKTRRGVVLEHLLADILFPTRNSVPFISRPVILSMLP